MKLLDLAGVDSRIGQIGHQMRSLPELEQIAALESSRIDLDNRVRDARIAVDDLNREQKKADRDVEQVKTRRERDQSRMEQGLVTNPKDLQNLSHELESLNRRISNLEDEELEVMERLEVAQGELARAIDEQAHVEEKLATLTASRDEKLAALTADLEAVQRQRGSTLEGIPADLLALYERIREKQGVGAAELRARRCGGCQLNITPSDLAVIAKSSPDEVVRCEECSRILIRTAESGI